MKYKKIPNYSGIRKVLSNGNYEVSKKINGKFFSRTFKSIKEAIYWRNTFNPFDSQNEVIDKHSKMKFSELWQLYEECYFPEIEKSSQGIKRQKIAIFKDELDDLSINDITPEYLDYLIKKKKQLALANPLNKRCSFKKTLDEVKAVLNWHKINYDYKFHNPVLRRHYTQGLIKKTPRKEKVLHQEQLIYFFKAIDNPLYQDFALIQFFCAARFGEIAGIQLKNIDLQNKSLLIKEVVVEDQSKRFLELKPYPKNGHPRAVAVTDKMFEAAILRRLDNLYEDCNYLFHIEGKPLNYRRVQFNYNKALKLAGLHPSFSSTHILRYSMASESRRIMGTLDAAQAITGHHSIKMIEHYAKLPTLLQGETVAKVGDALAASWSKLDRLAII
jgi:integrase